MLQCRDFYNVGIRAPKISTDHHVIMEELKGKGARRNHMYCKARSIWSIVTTEGEPIQEGDSHFSDLKNMVKKPTENERVAVSRI